MQHYNFNHLSVKDLAEARDMFHVHLINKKNVVATAIGRYLIRLTDIDKNGIYKPQANKPPRTLENSVVTDISWPCILVFVTEWAEDSDLIKGSSTDIIPKTIYMPDGRMVPVCIVEAPKQSVTNPNINTSELRFPDNLIGGGFPLFIKSQGITRIATVGCLVTDGNKYYALTNKHVSGISGEIVHSIMGGEEVQIGVGSGKALGKLPFQQLYGGWQGSNVQVSCDAGLIEVSNVRDWKTDVLEMGQMDEMFDLNTMNFTLGLIAEHKVVNGKRQAATNGLVVGFGAVTHKMEGEIAGLFYRYKSVGGVEYVSDFLISGREGSTLTVHHGDSGTVWHLLTSDEKQQQKLQPIALHWGQHEFIQSQQRQGYSYSLSTCLSNVCRELDVELVRGWNIDNDYSWGKAAHFKIAARACDIVSNKKLKKLLQANLENIAFTDQGMLNGAMKEAKWGNFCALADVPDIVWRMTRKSDDANHFADMDESHPNVMNGKTLMELCKSEANIDIDVWNKYYDGMKAESATTKVYKRGALPFRVWQAFDLMVAYVKAGKLAEFICVGGIVSHYLGDASQPLHVSHLHHGHPGAEGEEEVHSVYETNMIDRHMLEVINGVNKKYNTTQVYKTYKTGKDAAKAVIRLMDKVTGKILSPEEIIKCYNETGGTGRISNMWNKLGDRTIQCIAEGSLNLALFWESAWAAGNGDSIKDASLKEIKWEKLIELYMNNAFFPSYKLDDPKFKAALSK